MGEQAEGRVEERASLSSSSRGWLDNGGVNGSPNTSSNADTTEPAAQRAGLSFAQEVGAERTGSIPRGGSRALAARQRRLPEILLVCFPAGLLAALYLLLPSFTSLRSTLIRFADGNQRTDHSGKPIPPVTAAGLPYRYKVRFPGWNA